MSAALVHAQEPKPVGVTTEEEKDGFVSLFDGKTLNGWIGDTQHYAVEDGAMVCHGGNLFVDKEYANFILQFEFKLPPAGNNGVGIRTILKGALAHVGMEIQILDDGHPKFKTIDPIRPCQSHGSIYGVVAAKRGFLKPVGQWNYEEIIADGSHIKVTLNGTVITDADISKIDKPAGPQLDPGLHNVKGYVGWIGHEKDPVAFRNIQIKELPIAQ